MKQFFEIFGAVLVFVIIVVVLRLATLTDIPGTINLHFMR